MSPTSPRHLTYPPSAFLCQLLIGTCQEHSPAIEQQQGHLPPACAIAAADPQDSQREFRVESEAICAPWKLVEQVFRSVQSLSHVWLLATWWTAAHQASLSNSWSLLKLMSIMSVVPANHLILCHPLLLLSSIFPSIRVFSNESVLHIRWPKYWSFSLSISPSSEYSGLISFGIDWLDLLQGTLESSATSQFKSISSLALNLLYGPTPIHTWLIEKL